MGSSLSNSIPQSLIGTNLDTQSCNGNSLSENTYIQNIDSTRSKNPEIMSNSKDVESSNTLSSFSGSENSKNNSRIELSMPLSLDSSNYYSIGYVNPENNSSQSETRVNLDLNPCLNSSRMDHQGPTHSHLLIKRT